MATLSNRRIIITGPEVEGERAIPLSGTGKATIGRGEGNTLRVQHPLVSRQHAVLEGTVSQCLVTDLGSTYGTTINGTAIEPHRAYALQNGDEVELGPYRLTYHAGEASPTTAVGEKPPVIQPRRRRTMPPPPDIQTTNDNPLVPPGLSMTHSRYMSYLPDIYHPEPGEHGDRTPFLPRFMAMFESIWAPIEWNIDNFDLYLDPRTSPIEFTPWLANWFEIAFDDSWSDEQRRDLLLDAHKIYARRGTHWSLSRILEIYTGAKPEINDTDTGLDPYTFTVKIKGKGDKQLNRQLVEQLIDANKPAHTSYQLILDR